MAGPPRGPCSCFVDLINWLPVLLCAALFGWSYYAYLVFCLSVVQDPNVRIAYAVVFNILYFMCLWSYVQTVITPLPVVPYYFYVTEADKQYLDRAPSEDVRRSYLEVLGQNRGILTREFSGAVRYCEACSLVKPDRCHHCSMCRRCVLRMDHHCPWFNNCVCHSTYKYFLLTLFYVVVLSIFCVGTTAPHVRILWANVGSHFVNTFHVTFLSIVGIVLAIGLGSFLYFHLTLVFSNRTTLENMRRPTFKVPEDSFDIGSCQNFMEVFGDNPCVWPLPVFSSRGDGARFPTVLHRNRNVVGNV